MSLFNVLLVDDHAMFRTGLALVIGSAMPKAVVIEAASLDEAMSIDADTMEVVLLDIQLAGLNGLECIAPIRRRWPDVPVVVVSSHTDPESMRLATARGAAEFVSKAEPAARIVELIRGVLRRDLTSGPMPLNPLRARHLTPRQCEVLELLSQGLANKVIARRLELSENTVRRHVQDILVFFDVGSRAESVFVARQRGLVA